MSDKKKNTLRTLRSAACLLLIALYVFGLIAMMTISFRVGIVLWVVSTLGGVCMLYWVRTLEERAANDARANEVKSFGDDAQAGGESEPAQAEPQIAAEAYRAPVDEAVNEAEDAEDSDDVPSEDLFIDLTTPRREG